MWKNLRQEFGKQFRKCQRRSGDGAAEKNESQWPFFHKLLFLNDQFTPRNSSGNLTESELPAENYENSQDGEEVDEELMDISRENSNTVLPSPEATLTELCTSHTSTSDYITRTGYRKRLTPHAAIGKELLELEKEKLALVKRRKVVGINDEDVGFFNSLLPTVKKLSPRDKFIFRRKVQDTLFKLAFPQPEVETNITYTESDSFSVSDLP